MSDVVGDLVFQAKELKYLARGPRAYARRRTPAVRAVLGRALRITRPLTLARRRSVAATLGTPAFTIDERTGIARVPELPGGVIAGAVQEAQRIADGLDLAAMKAAEPERHLHAVSLAGKIGADSDILGLALADGLVSAIARYVQTVPVLEDVMLWYSPNEQMVEGTSQYYHLDGQDVRTLQVFVHLTDVDDDSGPLTAIAADVSEAVARDIRYRKNETFKRVPDDVVDAAVRRDEDRVALVGPVGTTHIVDTDRCLHYGSRAGKKPRLMLVIQYYSPFAFVLPRAWSSALPFTPLAGEPGFTDVQRLVLGAAR